MSFKSEMLCALTLWACGSIAVAAESGADALRACAAEKDDAIRLACYDREVGHAAAQPATAAAPAPVLAPTTPEAPLDTFGARGGEMARKKAREEEKTEIKEVTVRITALAQRPRGERVFTLDNGQVWVEKRRTPYLPVKEGDTVTITAGALSAFRLSVGGRSTQVQRLQ